MPPSKGQASMQALMRVLDLEVLEHNLFRGISQMPAGNAFSAVRSLAKP